MILAPLLPRLAEGLSLRQTIQELASRRARPAQLSLADVVKPAALAAIQASAERPALLITTRPGWARRYADELALWSPAPDEVALFPATDALPYEPLAPDPQQTAERLAVLARLVKRQGRPLIVASLRAVADKLMSPADFAGSACWLKKGQRVNPRALMASWLKAGYEAATLVEAPGQFAHRGGIVDVFPAASPDQEAGAGYRLEFWGDEIESIRAFDPTSQRSTGQVDTLYVPPAYEVLAGLEEPAWPSGGVSAAPVPRAARLHALRGLYGSASLLDYLPADALVILDEPAQLETAWTDLEQEAEQLRIELIDRGELPPLEQRSLVGWPELQRRLQEQARPTIILEHQPDRESLPVAHAPVFAGRLSAFLDDLAEQAERGLAAEVIIVSRQTARLSELLAERGLATADQLVSSAAQPAPRITLLHGALPEGWQSERLGVSLFTDGELFGVRKVRRPVRRVRAEVARETLLSELSEGDLVVHIDHGIARYGGLVRLEEPRDSPESSASGQAGREYLLLEYSAGDRLYVPVEQADRLARYLGGGDHSPALTRLGSGEWQRAKQRVRRAVRDIAQELLELYAARETAEGNAFSGENAWLRELEASFPYVETSDQLAAIEAVSHDMEQPRPMDRLLVGDVGYGKTEVALRAAFRAVLGGKQVAVLVPTTVLAQQHYHTFRQRLEAFPVRVEMLSRFRSEREQREIVEGLANGTVDICIGTHRLVQKDVRFKDLGLAIIDEEQRFGVAHKERLKQLRREVDVLTMTATPIPRTLHMALSGVRDMSVIATAPVNRVPIRTYLAEFDDSLIREALRRELERGGQVYFVHDRVQGIEQLANRLSRLVPEARVTVAHGQMAEEQLEQAMLAFAEGAADVLVCTTIIESGLDIPNVNTIIVNNAHHFGLAQLYQLRGRVGRGAARAYAYFLHGRNGLLTETAEQRLRTIFEATELGAGFRIAMKDLEIRGAGTLLGAEQSGHIGAVGFDLYTRLLGEAVQALKAAQAGQPVRGQTTLAQPSLNLPLEASLPSDYVADEQLRLNLYQRLAAADDGPALGALIDELEDRFGPLPAAAQNLVYLLSLRLTAARAGVEEIAAQDGQLIVRFRRLPKLDVAALARQLGVRLGLGSNQVRLPLDGSLWMPRLVTLLEAAAGEAVGETNGLGQPVATHAGQHQPDGRRQRDTVAN